MAQKVRKIATGAGAALLILSVLSVLSAPRVASSAEIPRRIAIAPFVNLTGQDEIKPVVSVLPRLISTRLMALAGAETLLIPAGEKGPEEAAKEAKVSLLLQGTVSKLGKGYSIDTTVTDLSTGTPAAAFFASAATEDEIIPQLGVLAADMAEKLFGVKTARPQPAAAPAPAGPAVPGLPPATAAAPPAAVRPEAPPAPVPAAVPAGPWEPKKIEKVGMSDKIPDTILRVSAGDVDGDGIPDVAAIGGRRLFMYKVAGDNVVPVQKVERGPSHLFLNVEMADLDGDGSDEVVVTDLVVGDRLESFVVKYRGGTAETLAENVPYFIVSLEDGKGNRRLAGQMMGVSEPYAGKVVFLKWDGKGKTLVADGDVPVAVNAGIFGLASFPGDAQNRFLYIDADEHLRLVDRKGKTSYKTKEYFSGAIQQFIGKKESRDTAGPERHYIRGRVYPIVQEGRPTVLLVRQAKGSSILKDLRSFDWSRLVLLSWDGSGFVEKGASEKMDNLMTDFAVLGRKPAPGARVAVPVIDWSAAPYSSPESSSRLHIYRIE